MNPFTRQSRLLTRPLIAACLCYIACCTTARAQDDSAFSRGEAAFARGDYAGALLQFEAARAAGASGPSVRYNIGVSQYKLGRYAAAESTFRELAAAFPQMRDLALYNVALSLDAMGEERRALEIFASLERSSDSTVAGLAARQLERAREMPSSGADRSWVRMFDFMVGNDSNVALADDSILPTGQTNSSPFSEVIGYASGAPGNAERWRLDLSGYLVSYADASSFDQSALSGAALRGMSVGTWQVEAGPRIVHSTLDGDGFERRLGLAFRARHAIGANTSLELRASLDDVEDLDSLYAGIAGDRSDMLARLRHTLVSGTLVATVSLERNDRLDPGVSPDRERLILAYRRPLGSRWNLEGQLMHRSSEYGVSPTPRDETLVELTLTGSRNFASGWQLNAQVQYADNDSSDALFEYTRSRVGIGLSKLF